MRKIISSLLFSIFVFVSSSSGQEDPTLFSVNGNQVGISEFDYIYNKNNGDNADYSKESLEEYLDLYIKFKLKVEKAKDMGLDTIQRLQDELAGYRKQLASSYLVDKEVSEKLIDEVLERMNTDIAVSHIFVSDPPNASPDKRAKSLERVNSLYGELERGKNFEELAKKLSDDKRSGLKGGALGHYVAMLPAGFYQFENAMYETPIGEFAKPVKSKMGYHIIQVTGKRPARGELEVSHILLKKEDKSTKLKIDSLHAELGEGQDFGKLATLYSEDPNTNTKAGYLGFFRINQFDKSFEEAAFALASDGDYSVPIETEFGWHIIKRHSAKEKEDESKLRRKIQGKISKDERFEAAKKELIENIKDEVGLKENKIALAKFSSKLNEEFYSYKWRVPKDLDDVVLLSIGDSYEKKLTDFADYCKNDTRSRLRYNKTAPLEESVELLYQSYVDDRILAYEEANLANKYPEFKALMREYEEGILLFEATKMEVWDKASLDSVGLAGFYAQNADNYKWGKRWDIEDYSLKSTDAKLIKKLTKKASSKSMEELKEMTNIGGKELLFVNSRVVEAGTQDAEEMDLVVGQIINKRTEAGMFNFSKVKSEIPGKNKSLKEARGYIIADYQDLLEKNWIEELRNKYEVDLNQGVFDSLVKIK